MNVSNLICNFEKRTEKKQSGLLPSGYPFGGLIKLQPAWGAHGLYWENNEVETKKLLGEKVMQFGFVRDLPKSY